MTIHHANHNLGLGLKEILAQHDAELRRKDEKIASLERALKAAHVKVEAAKMARTAAQKMAVNAWMRRWSPGDDAA